MVKISADYSSSPNPNSTSTCSNRCISYLKLIILILTIMILTLPIPFIKTKKHIFYLLESIPLSIGYLMNPKGYLSGYNINLSLPLSIQQLLKKYLNLIWIKSYNLKIDLTTLEQFTPLTRYYVSIALILMVFILCLTLLHKSSSFIITTLWLPLALLYYYSIEAMDIKNYIDLHYSTSLSHNLGQYSLDLAYYLCVSVYILHSLILLIQISLKQMLSNIISFIISIVYYICFTILAIILFYYMQQFNLA